MIFWMILSLLATSISEIKAQTCDFVGPKNPGSMDQNLETGVMNQTIIQLSTPYDVTSTCACGKITDWVFRVNKKATFVGNQTINFHIWHWAGASFQLLSTTTCVAEEKDKDKEVTCNVPINEQILATTGDVIGFHVPGEQMIAYNNGDDYCFSTTVGDLTSGDVVNWAGQTCGGKRDYAFKAVIASAANPPTFVDPTQTKSASDTDTVGKLITTFPATDIDGGDLFYSMTSSSTYFSFDANSQGVFISTTPPSGSYTLNFEVTDSCNLTDTATLTINVINTPPVINNLPTYGYIREDETSEIFLHLINTSDPSPGDSVRCYLDDLEPNSGLGNFLVKIVPGTMDYGIYSVASPSYDYQNQKTYKVKVACTDDVSVPVKSFYRIYVTDNKPPIITNLQGQATASAQTTFPNDVIFNVIANDTECDPLSYTLSCDSWVNPCPFAVDSNGGVYSTSGLIGTLTPAYELYIKVSDAVSTVGPKTLTVLVQDINTPPVISNLPLTFPLAIEENIPVGRGLFNVTYKDPDDFQTLNYDLSVSPISGTTYFSISNSGEITTLKTIDYELMTPALSYSLNVTINDGQHMDTKTLDVIILNVNEAPVFMAPVYVLVGTEGQAGTAVGTPSFVTMDPDGDSLTYSIDCPEFYMDATTAAVTLAIDYDLDLAGTASTVVCLATVSDGELSGTATLSITLNQVNDNAPTFGLQSYIFTTSVYQGVGDVIGSISATDNDLGLYGTIYYTLDMSTFAHPYFNVDTLGNVKLALDAEGYLGSGTSISFKANVTDYGGLYDQCDVIVIVQATTTLPPTTTTERYRTFIENPANAGWLTGLVLVTAFFLVLLAGLAYIKGHFDPVVEQCRNKCGRKRRYHAKRQRHKKSYSEGHGKSKRPSQSSTSSSTSSSSSSPTDHKHKRRASVGVLSF